MTDIAATIADVLREHRKSWYIQSAVAKCLADGCTWGMFGTSKSTSDGHATHLAEVVEAALATRWALIELPEPNVIAAHGITYSTGGGCECCPPWVRDDGIDYTPDEARSTAAALIAAARIAEGGAR